MHVTRVLLFLGLPLLGCSNDAGTVDTGDDTDATVDTDSAADTDTDTAVDTDTDIVPVVAELLATGIDCPLDLAVDSSDVYAVVHVRSWSDDVPGSILRAPKDGSGAQTFIADQYTMTRLTLDANDVYWNKIGSGGNGAVNRLSKAGSTVQTFTSGRSKIWDVQVDAIEVFWGGYEIARQGKGESAATWIGGSANGTAALAIDNWHAYFSIGDEVTLLARVPLGGGAVEPIVPGTLNADGIVYLQASNIELDDTHVYWTADGGTGILRTLKDGTGEVEMVMPDFNRRFAVDDTSVYWADPAGAVMRAPKDGTGKPTIVYDGDTMFGSIAHLPIIVDDTHVYWGFCGGIRSAVKQ